MAKAYVLPACQKAYDKLRDTTGIIVVIVTPLDFVAIYYGEYSKVIISGLVSPAHAPSSCEGVRNRESDLA